MIGDAWTQVDPNTGTACMLTCWLPLLKIPQNSGTVKQSYHHLDSAKLLHSHGYQGSTPDVQNSTEFKELLKTPQINEPLSHWNRHYSSTSHNSASSSRHSSGSEISWQYQKDFTRIMTPVALTFRPASWQRARFHIGREASCGHSWPALRTWVSELNDLLLFPIS